MKTLKPLLLIVVLTLSGLSLRAQEQKPVYFISETMKATPGKTAEYIAAELGAWKKINQERVKRGHILSWSLYQVRYPGGTDVPYDFVTVTVVENMNKLENTFGTMWDEGGMSFLTKAEQEQAMSIGTLRNLTTSTVLVGSDYAAANPNSTTQAKYAKVNYMKVKDGKQEAAMMMESKLMKPVIVELMKTGGKSAWGLYSRVMPGGSSQPFDYCTVDFYTKWEDMGKDWQNMDKTLAKVHPGMSAAYMSEQIESPRDMVNVELWELIGHVE